jgi:hypothetical protein
VTLIYDPLVPVILQKDSWSCLTKSIRWSLSAYGIAVPEGYLEKQVRGSITNRGGYLNDKTGHDLADFMTQEFGNRGLTAEYTPSVAWDEVVRDAGRYAMVIGGSNFLHYAAVRGYDAQYDILYLANSVPTWRHLGHKMTRHEFEYYGPLARIRVATPHMIAEGERYRGTVGLRGLYRAVTIGASTVYLPAERGGVGDPEEGPGVVARGLPGSRRPRGDGRVLHELLTRRTA